MITLHEIEEMLRSKIVGEDHKRVLESNSGYMAFHALSTVIWHLMYARRAELLRANLRNQIKYRQLKHSNNPKIGPLASQRTRGARPRYEGRPDIFQRQNTDQKLIAKISEIGKIPPLDAKEIVSNAYRRDVLRLVHILSNSTQEHISHAVVVKEFIEQYRANTHQTSISTFSSCFKEILSFLSPLYCDNLWKLFKKHAYYPHITSQEFLERKTLDDDGNPILDAKGNLRHYENPLKTVYGSYVTNLAPINEKLNKKAAQKGIKTKFRCQNIEEVRKAILKVGGVDFGELSFSETDTDDLEENPFRILLVHPEIHLRFSALANLDEAIISQIGYYMILFTSSLEENSRNDNIHGKEV